MRGAAFDLAPDWQIRSHAQRVRGSCRLMIAARNCPYRYMPNRPATAATDLTNSGPKLFQYLDNCFRNRAMHDNSDRILVGARFLERLELATEQ